MTDDERRAANLGRMGHHFAALDNAATYERHAVTILEFHNPKVVDEACAAARLRVL